MLQFIAALGGPQWGIPAADLRVVQGILGLGGLLVGGSLVWGSAAYAREPLCPDEPTPEVTDATSGVISLGHLPGYSYVVVVPGDDEAQLEALKRCYPAAFISGSSRGDYIYVAGFETHAAAKRLSDRLRAQRFDARVVYHHRLGQVQGNLDQGKYRQ